MAEPREPPHGFAVRLALKARLDRLPIVRAKRAGERRAEHGLANPRVRAGDDEAHGYCPSRSSSKRSASIISPAMAEDIFNVSAIRSRAVPSGTVGGRMARMS